MHTRRLDTYALRLMILLAINDGKRQIDLETVEKVRRIVNWELDVRRESDPIDAENSVAKMEESIRRELDVKGPLSDRQLRQLTNANRAGIWHYETARDNLSRMGEITKAKRGKMVVWKLVT